MLLVGLLFAVSFGWVALFALRRHNAVRGVFKSHAESLRARAAGAPPAERAALEAEAADVEAAASDWPRILHDDMVLAAPTRVGGSFFNNTRDRSGSHTVAEKEAAADERSALLARHGAEAFAGVRKAAHRKPDFWRDGLFVVPLAVLVLGPLAYVASKTPCDAPLFSLCVHAVADTYACAFDAAGACVATPK